MSTEWPANVTRTIELGSQTGYAGFGFDELINRHLALGWRILNTYVGRQEPSRDECYCLLGWPHDGEPKTPDFKDGDEFADEI